MCRAARKKGTKPLPPHPSGLVTSLNATGKEEARKPTYKVLYWPRNS